MSLRPESFFDSINPLPFNLFTLPQNLNRLKEVYSVLVKHGFGQIVSQLERNETFVRVIQSFGISPQVAVKENTTYAVRLRMVFQDLGPTFIKFGQILSTRPDLIPDDFIIELKNLQDNVPTFSFEEAKEQIESELGRPLSDIYDDFPKSPLGTASIGQAYSARLKTGQDVVVKIQRPNVLQIIESDIDILYFLAELAEKYVQALLFLDLTGIIKEFHQAIVKELDYRIELRNGLKFAETFKDNPNVVIPRFYKEFCSRKILTMERLRGVKITSASEVGSDKKVLARIALKSVFTMVFESGFFHADPHPGNIFALPDNRIGFLDLGMVGSLNEEMRFKLAGLIKALFERDEESVARCLLSMGIREGKVNQISFRREVRETMDKFIDLPLAEIQFSEIVKDLISGARRNRIKIPKEYTLMGKALMTVEGVGKDLDPELDVQTEIAPYIMKLVMLRFSPKRIYRELENRLADLYVYSNEIPQHFLTILDDLQAGNLKVKVEDLGQNKFLKALEMIFVIVTAGLILASMIISSALLVTFSRVDATFLGLPITFVLGLSGFLAVAILGWRLNNAVVKLLKSD